MLSEQEFEDLVRYVSDNVEHDLDRATYRIMDDYRCGVRDTGTGLAEAIDQYAEEWCEEHDIDTFEYYGYYDTDDVFFHDAYEFDAR